MKSVFAPFAAVLALAATVAAQDLVINTPNPAPVCQPVLLTWGGGQPPYFVSISMFPAGQPTATPVLDFGRQDGTQLTWIANQTVGLSFGLTIRDNTGLTKQSGTFPIIAGSDTSCLNGGSTGGSTGSSAAGNTGSSTSAPGNTAAPGTSATAAPGTSVTPAPGGGATSASSSTKPNPSATSSGSASHSSAPSSGNKIQVGITGIVGAALLALLA